MDVVSHVAHDHIDEKGFAHKCWHSCRGLLTSWQFYVGTFGTFLPEHLVWDKVPPFDILTKALGI